MAICDIHHPLNKSRKSKNQIILPPNALKLQDEVVAHFCIKQGHLTHDDSQAQTASSHTKPV